MEPTAALGLIVSERIRTYPNVSDTRLTDKYFSFKRNAIAIAPIAIVSFLGIRAGQRYARKIMIVYLGWKTSEKSRRPGGTGSSGPAGPSASDGPYTHPPDLLTQLRDAIYAPRVCCTLEENDSKN